MESTERGNMKLGKRKEVKDFTSVYTLPEYSKLCIYNEIIGVSD